MLDKFIIGDVERISPEAPIPVVIAQKELSAPGGAGNVASNIAALGGVVSILGLVGNDSAMRDLLKEFKKRKINAKGIIKSSQRPTCQKIRIVARNQQMVRVDKEDNHYIHDGLEEKVINFARKNIKNWDGLVISDYAKGFITQNLATEIISLAKKHKKPIIGDTKPKHAAYFKNITLLTPNYKEATEISGIADVKKSGKAIQRKLNANVLITRGAEGMSLFEGKKIVNFTTKAKEVFDVAGAGDTVVATLILSLVSGANLEEAAVIANHAAGIAVAKVGTAAVSQRELKMDLKECYLA